MNNARNRFAGKTILVAEDTESDFYLLERTFKDVACAAELRRVCDGVEVIQYLAGEEGFSNRDAHPFPHLLLLDLQMPRKDGFAVLEWVRRQDGLRRLPIVIFSSSGRTEDVRRAYDLGASSFLVKPMIEEYALLVRSLAEYWLGLNESADFNGNGASNSVADMRPSRDGTSKPVGKKNFAFSDKSH